MKFEIYDFDNLKCIQLENQKWLEIGLLSDQERMCINVSHNKANGEIGIIKPDDTFENVGFKFDSLMYNKKNQT